MRLSRTHDDELFFLYSSEIKLQSLPLAHIKRENKVVERAASFSLIFYESLPALPPQRGLCVLMALVRLVSGVTGPVHSLTI